MTITNDRMDQIWRRRDVLVTWGDTEGLIMRVRQAERRRDQWERRAKLLRQGRIDEIARGTMGLFQSAAAEVVRRSAQRTIALIEERLLDPDHPDELAEDIQAILSRDDD